MTPDPFSDAPRFVAAIVSAFPRSWAERYGRTFSYWGLVVATCFFAASLTPSLLPRPYAVQGLLSGLALAVGYGVGVFLVWLWRYLELPVAGARLDRVSRLATGVGVSVVAAVFLWRASVWQNSIRELMELEPLTTAEPWRVGGIAFLTGVVLVALVRVVRIGWRRVERLVGRFVPRRVSYVLSTLLVLLALFVVANKLVARAALTAADAVFLQLDKFDEEDLSQPTAAMATGSAASRIPWDTIGRQGKRFILTGPTQEDIRQFLGRPAQRPLRVYVGMRTTKSMPERAQLALEELQRVGGFDRSVLVVAIPTGTGWLDPGGVDTLEYLHAGDTAIVSIQYSYLPSWITILIDPDRSRDAARALFDAVYNYWIQLPRAHRPRLYLHGLSLGSLGSESSADLFSVFEDPIQGGVWSGPPFPSARWAQATRYRNPDSPMWRPTFRDGSMLRFTGRESCLEEGHRRWGPMRFVYIQHSSDPMTFFSPNLLYQRPDWLRGPRGPDVSPYLRWYPIVTFLQIGFDLPMATSVPIGYGHNYAPASYLDAWVAVSQPAGWNGQDTERLKQWLATRAVGALARPTDPEHPVDAAAR